MKTSERLLARIRAEVPAANVPEGAQLRRTYAGPNQRSQGAWSWYVVDAEGREAIPHLGSAESVGTLLRAKSISSWGDGLYVEIGGD